MTIALIGALVIGISLGLLGSGGSILTVPILVYLVGHAEKAAIAESLAIVGIISLVGAARRLKGGNVDIRAALQFGPSSVVGAWGGAMIADFIPGPVQLLILGLIMFAAAALMFRPPKLEREEGSRPHPAVLIIAGAVVGIITGLVGIGGGFLIVPTLVIAGGVRMHSAVGTSLLLITANCIIGFATYWSVLRDSEITINWQVIAIFGAIGAVGSVIGQWAAGKLSQRALKRIFAIFIVAIAIWMLIREIPHVFGQSRPAEAAMKHMDDPNSSAPAA